LKKTFPKAINQSLTLVGIALSIQGKYQQAMRYTNKSLQASEIVKDSTGISENCVLLGVIFEEQGNYPRALEYYNRALTIDEKIGYEIGIAMSLNNIANIYVNQGNYVKALEYYERALTIDEKLGVKQGIAIEISNISSIYNELGNKELAMEYAIKAYNITKEIGDIEAMPSMLNTIGALYFEQGDFAEALSYFEQSLEINSAFENPRGLAQTYKAIGNLHLKSKNFSGAIENCEITLKLAKEVGLLEIEQGACYCLYKGYKSLGETSKALAFYEQSIKLKDKIYNEENTQKLTRLEMQYEFDKKESEAKAEQDKKDAIAQKEIQRQKLVRNAFVSGFLAVLLFAAVFFVQRNKISKEKERSEELLLNILPEETAKELKEKGSADAQLIEQVTVLFTDFKGFTAISEKLSPKALVKDLHECFSAFDRICGKYGIEKIKTIGDAYMAAGGLPTPNQTHAQDVVKAALEIAEFVELGKQRKIENGEPFFEIRVGVHTGPVVAGIVGIKKFQYDIWGDTVNTASRMESSGAVGKVNVSQSTYTILKDNPAFAFESRGKIAAKGKGEIEMYFVNAKSNTL